jgi:hypothetical protein
MYFGATSRRACGRAVAAGARAGAPVFGCIGLRVQSPLRTRRWAYHAHAMRGLLSMASARSPPRLPIVARRVRPHARAVRGRSISFTKVQALPEWLGQCKLLETLCVPRRAAAVRVCGGAGAALLTRGAAAPGAGAAPLGVGCGGGGVAGRRLSAEPTHAWLARAADRPAVRGGPEPPGAAARWARREAHYTELAALPAVADWPSLKYL